MTEPLPFDPEPDVTDFINPIAASILQAELAESNDVPSAENDAEAGDGHYGRCSLVELVEDVLAVLQHRSPEIKVWVELEPLAEWYCDRNEIRTVLLSLISRAIEAVPRLNGHVCIRCQAEGAAHTRLDIIDNGRGIPHDQLMSIFRPGKRFIEGKNGEAIAQANLFSIRNIIGLHGGAIAVESYPGEGTTFSITLESALPAELVA
tara:strand:+ start:15255 stop:15872 length:618 start_codon:yes stop_codon:yes gene_type:complete